MFDTAFLDLPPLLAANGTVLLPGSKSISNRVLLLAGLCRGSTLVRAVLDSDDTRVMIAALQQLGCVVAEDAAGLRITGIGGRLPVHTAELFLGNAGTAMRPLAAALALLTTTRGGRFDLSGVARMHERPIGDLVDALRQLGCHIDYLGKDGYPPLRLGGIETETETETGTRTGTEVGTEAGIDAQSDGLVPRLNLDSPIRVRGDVSSQFLTALLLALPLVVQSKPAIIEVDGELISKPYVEITLNLLKRFGVYVDREGWSRFSIPQGAGYVSPGDIAVEGDASSASYFVAMGAIAATGTDSLRIEGVGARSIQGDIRFLDAAEAMGATIVRGDNHIDVKRGAWPLRPIDLDCNHIPDAAMTLAAMALYADGTTRLRNIGSWRVKETDRLSAMAIELRKLGASVNEGSDFIEITAPAHWQAASLDTYDDHRMAMCGSLAAFNGLTAGDATHPVGVRIVDPKCVAKTFPDYFETMFGITSTLLEHVPVITVDGPTASGKGTVASALAQKLGYHFLDSGAVYRATALAATWADVDVDDERGLAELASNLDLRFRAGEIFLGGNEVADLLRLEEIGAMASKISAWPAVRTALKDLQLGFRRVPGLVADGRDMGTVVFPGAALKVFLTASAATRAERRHRQLIAKGVSSNIDSLREDLEARDLRDRSRVTAPLIPAEDALLLDNSALTAASSVDVVLDWWQQRRPFKPGSAEP